MMKLSLRPHRIQFPRKNALAMLLISILFVSMFMSFLANGANAAYVYVPLRDVSAQKNLDVAVTYESLHMKSGSTLAFFVTVTENGFPANASLVNFTHDAKDLCFFEYENGGLTDPDGKVVVRMTAYSENGMMLNDTARSSLEGYMPGYHEIKDITVEPPVVIDNTSKVSYIGITGLI
ncbi:MAG: hypothetical protein R6W91_07305, partial [Thermoplasmata archaeon]